MLLLSKKDIQKVFTMKDAVEADKEAFTLFSEGKSVVPLRTNMTEHFYLCLLMWKTWNVRQLKL